MSWKLFCRRPIAPNQQITFYRPRHYGPGAGHLQGPGSNTRLPRSGRKPACTDTRLHPGRGFRTGKIRFVRPPTRLARNIGINCSRLRPRSAEESVVRVDDQGPIL